MTLTKIKLPFGLNENNIIVHIANVESGENCNCVCPDCKSPLIAVKGNKKQHHFRHKDINECKGGLESAIHLAAKQMIMENKQITLPELVSVASAIDSRGVKYTECETVVQNGTIVTFESVEEEKELHGMKTDILATTGKKQLMIEIFYRHKVEDEKIEKIMKANISAIEIDLSDLTPEDVKYWETFWSCINDPKRIKWLYNVKEHGCIHPNLENKLTAMIQQQEIKYEREEIIKLRQAQKEKGRLLQALVDLKVLHSKEYTTQLKQDAEAHPVWKKNSKYLPFSWHGLPDFLNIDVPDGDWIFGCDRRIWQIAFYNAFIRRKRDKQVFSLKWVDDWLQNKVGCKVPRPAKIIGIYGKRYPELVPPNVLENMPSSWATLRAYFNHLCKLGILEFSPSEWGWGHKGDSWFRIISKTPDEAHDK